LYVLVNCCMFYFKKLNSFKNGLFISGLFIALFLLTAFLFPDFYRVKLAIWTRKILEIFGGFYLLLGLGAVLIMLILSLSPIGSRRLGEEKPEYSWFSWIAMLYSTGMGAGLLLRAVQEPVYYYSHPPRESILSRGEFALQYTFFHWGLTPWAFYGLFGLVIAYNLYERNGTVLSSSILGTDYQKSVLAGIMDAITIICTLLGVVAAAGLGSRQLHTAIQYWTGLNELASGYTVFLVLLVGILATLSAFLGLSRGIRNLSNLNIFLALALLLFVGIRGADWMLPATFLKTIGFYLLEFFPMSLNLGGYQVSRDFLTDWTYFYWAFWLSWAPFTGVFIARISKGRTIREFVLGTLIVPVLGTFLWFTFFGSSAFELVEAGKVSADQLDSIYSAIFNFFAAFPASGWSNTATTILVFTFLITSIDSAIFVLSMFSKEGSTQPGKKIRLFWGVIISLTTMAVILLGQDHLLKSVSQLLILFALPFSFLFVAMLIFLFTKSSLNKR
jgi:glycine betaine transporter